MGCGCGKKTVSRTVQGAAVTSSAIAARQAGEPVATTVQAQGVRLGTAPRIPAMQRPRV